MLLASYIKYRLGKLVMVLDFDYPEFNLTSSAHRSSGGGGSSRPMTSDERLDYERRRAEMVRNVLTGGAAEEAPAEEPKQEPLSIDRILPGEKCVY